MNKTDVTNLKLSRVKSGIKAWRLASIVGIHPTKLSHYETGRNRCPANIRYKLAEVLEVPVDELFPNEKEEI